MKKLLFLSFIFPAFLIAQEAKNEINWVTLTEAEKLMEKEPRKVLVDVYTEWCGPCKMMNNTTFKDPTVVKYINEHYYAVKFNAEGPEEINFKGNTFKNEDYDPAKARTRNSTHDLTKAIAPVNGRIAYPTIVYMTEEFQIISPVQGMKRPEEILPILTFIGDDHFKDKTWEEYLQAGN